MSRDYGNAVGWRVARRVKRRHRRRHDRVDGAGRGHDADLDVLVGVGVDELPIKKDAM
jgi:hypothetical protein